jgi:type II secretory pathway component PulF
MGNAVEGTVTANNELFASDEVRRMGYTPVRVQAATDSAAGGGTVVPSAAPGVSGTYSGVLAPPQATASPVTHAIAGPAPIDLTQPITELPAAANALLVPATGENDTTARMERLEPWQRGGPVPQSPAPQALNGVGPTQAMPAMAGTTYSAQYRAEGAHAVERPRIPYLPGVRQKVSFSQRFKEVLIYPIFSGVVVKDLAPFFRQFATLLDAGLPLYQALVALENNTVNHRLKEIARQGQAQVQAGGRFSDVMAAYPWVFQPMQIELVRAGEQGGMLEQILLQIADYIEHELEIRRLISRETIYPKFVLFCALMILGKPGFEGEMPAVAKLVVGSMGKLAEAYTFGSYLQDTVLFGLMLAVPFLVLVALFRLFLFNVPGVREWYDRIKMAIPGLGKLVRQFAIAKFGYTFAALYRAGFSMGTALQISGDACGNGVIRNATARAIPVAERGGLVSDALQNSDAFSPIALDMFRTGETTGNLDDMMEKMADFHEKEARTKSHMVAVGFGVLVFIIVALLVGRAIISQYMGYANGISAAAGGE